MTHFYPDGRIVIRAPDARAWCDTTTFGGLELE